MLFPIGLLLFDGPIEESVFGIVFLCMAFLCIVFLCDIMCFAGILPLEVDIELLCMALELPAIICAPAALVKVIAAAVAIIILIM
ncbi:hypothetical protein [Sphingomonas sp. CROZ-RG-20F-R02-07]|uniref:hypothetical protein n=1 Tax=Sphingomonas sp. CROZ-RG-20F-R02-07 TaxID=2914832 RepID=UPI001F5725AA|nr:hypothetical protein [Sphingomonas sp. CROZ-RG-20F-R02-07]